MKQIDSTAKSVRVDKSIFKKLESKYRKKYTFSGFTSLITKSGKYTGAFNNQGISIYVNGSKNKTLGISGERGIKIANNLHGSGPGAGDAFTSAYTWLLKHCKIESKMPSADEAIKYGKDAVNGGYEEEIVKMINSLDASVNYTIIKYHQDKKYRLDNTPKDAEKKFSAKVMSIYIMYHFNKLSTNE